MSNQPAPNIMEFDHSPDTENINIQDTSLSLLQNDCSTELHTESQSNQEATDNDKKSDDSDQTSNKSRELKSLLALSKEANLKTNISHKRKKESPRTFSSDTEIRKSVKLASDSKHFKFPVTAEAELDELHQENDVKVHNESLKVVKRKRDSLSENSSGGVDAEEFGKRNKKTAHMEFKVFKPNKDIFCWRCHREGVNVVCETCSRSYHQKCLKQTITDATHWPCPECVAILKAESTQTRSPAMKGMTLEHLCSLLKFAVHRMIQCQGSEPFLHPVSDKEFPEYKKYIIQPMDLTMLEKNIKDNLYGSTQAFEADAKWLLHNSIIFNSYQSKLTSAAKAMIKICKQEMMEIENCPSCYLKANTNKSTWFVEVCPKPHILVWAKLKGFPYWPAKAMSISGNGMVDVRFFGAHDRAWVHYKECYLYSEKDPNTFKQKRFDIEKCVEELNIYIDNLKKIYGEFRYAPFRTALNSDDIYKQLTIFLPKYKSIKARRKSFRDSSDVKTDEHTDTKSETIPKEEVIEEPEKSETSSNGRSNVNSPVHDNDTTMEGYGTDDDMHSEIDHESRRAFVGTKVLNYDKIEDEDDEDDTQVPSNISVENSVLRGNVRTRGGFNNSTGKLKILPPMSAENLLSDDITSPTRKTSRRNSDQSVKSDSSRISSKSDKINRVNISENMEITLGNEDIGCVSISENLSPINGESSRSESENNFEIKKKPVQVDIENAEFSISPNKVKISDQLIKKISDEKKIENVKKSLDNIDSDGESSSSVSKKQPKKTNLNGDFKKSPDEKNDENTPAIKKKIENILSEYELESKTKTIQPSITEYMIVVPKILEENLLLESQPSNISNDDTSEKTDSEKKIDSAPDTIPENMDVDLPPTTKQDIITSSPSKTISEIQAEIAINKAPEERSVSEKDMHVSGLDKEVSNSDSDAIMQVSDSKTQVDNENVSLEKISQGSSLAKEPSTSSTSEKIVQKELATIEPVRSSSLNHNYCKKMEKSIEESLKNRNIEVVAISESKNNLKAVSEREVSEKLGNLIGLEITLSKAKPITKLSEHSEKTEDSSGKPTSPSKERSDSPKKVLNKEINDILEEFEEEEEEEIDTVDKIVYDKKKIFDVIHSSLKLREQEMDIEKDKHVEVSQKSKEVSQQTSKKEVEITKKRKLMPDVTHSPAKIVKLVSIESILNRKDKDETEKTEKSTDKSPEKPPALVPEACIAPENIKSEPESEDEIMDETGEMEEKRKYLYALNIHEKTAESEKIERNEIRTRSKAEEKRERFKVVDNLTRIIDDVAMNYSALHEGEKIPQRKPERRKSNGVPHSHEGEIFVKSFAKIQTPPTGKQKARKTFPMPLYLNQTVKSLVSVPKRDISLFKREQTPQKILNSTISLKPVQEKSVTSSPSTSTKTVTSIAVSSVPTSTNLIHQTTVTSGAVSTQTSVGLTPSSCGVATSTSSSLNVGPATSVVPSLIATPTAHTQSMAMGHVILMPGSTLSYCTPISNPSINTVLRTSTSLSTPLLSSQTQQSVLKNIKKAPNLKTSQNYIPHEDTDSSESAPPTNAANHSLDELSNLQAPNTPVSPASNNIEPSSNTTNPPTTASIEQEDEFAVLNGLVPESVSLAVSELLLRAPPRLKPRPPAITSQIFDEGIPSSAGDVTTKINSIAHRMTDYFRGMLIETLEDIGKTASPEAKIAGLHLEIEAIKHRHSLEMAEMRKNMCTILKDIQRSIVEEREKIVDETRAACENETIKRVELAKSKQWCANCPKEAQFYCCWNTSYCDYPCQQKHWPQHAGKCTQSIEKVTGTGAVPPPRPPGQPIVLRPAMSAPKPMGRIIGKPTKVYMNKTSTPQKSVSKTVPSGLTLVETTPGNFELVGNGSIGLGGKIYTTTSAAALASAKYKPTSSSTGTSSRPSDQSRQASSSGTKPQYII